MNLYMAHPANLNGLWKEGKFEEPVYLFGQMGEGRLEKQIICIECSNFWVLQSGELGTALKYFYEME